MAISSSGQEAERVLKLLLGLGHAPAADIMRRHGFAETDLEEGWRYLHAVAARRLPRGAAARPRMRLIERLDAWEGVWFPVASAALAERFPHVRAWLFRDLPPDDAEAVVASVGVFLQRLLRMRFEPALGARGAEARELLARQGIDDSTVRIASELLELVCTAQDDDPSDAGAEAALRSWYSRWSEIARVAITDRQLLQALGVRVVQS
jgi:hypothetical protein